MKNIEKYQQIFLEQFPISVSDLNEEYTRESEDLWDDFASLAMRVRDIIITEKSSKVSKH